MPFNYDVGEFVICVACIDHLSLGAVSTDLTGYALNVWPAVSVLYEVGMSLRYNNTSMSGVFVEIAHSVSWC